MSKEQNEIVKLYEELDLNQFADKDYDNSEELHQQEVSRLTNNIEAIFKGTINVYNRLKNDTQNSRDGKAMDELRGFEKHIREQLSPYRNFSA